MITCWGAVYEMRYVFAWVLTSVHTEAGGSVCRCVCVGVVGYMFACIGG